MILQANGIHRNVGVAILTSDKMNNKGNKRQRWAFYNNKKDRTLKRHDTS